MDTTNINISLEKLGLSEGQSAVYVYLLQNGTLPANTLSRRLGITRTLVYKYLEDLIAMDLVSKDESYKVTRFSASHPYAIRKLVESSQKLVDEKERVVESLLPSLTSLYNLESNKPAVHFMEGLAGVENALNDTLTATETIYMYVDTTTLEEEVLDIDAAYVKKRLKKGLRKQILTPPSPAAEVYVKSVDDEFTEVRTLNASYRMPEFHSVEYIYDKKLVYITYQNNSLTATIMQDESIYTMQRALFDLLWTQAKTG